MSSPMQRDATFAWLRTILCTPSSPKLGDWSARSLSTYARVAYQSLVLRQPERSVAADSLSRAFLCSPCEIVYRSFPLSPITLKHRERQRGCALRRGGLLLRY